MLSLLVVKIYIDLYTPWPHLDYFHANIRHNFLGWQIQVIRLVGYRMWYWDDTWLIHFIISIGYKSAMNKHSVLIIIAIMAINILNTKENEYWKETIKRLEVVAKVVQLDNYYPIRNLSYDPFFFHTLILQSDR